jgi:hypothetical protein
VIDIRRLPGWAYRVLSWTAGLGGLIGLVLALLAAYSMLVMAPWDTRPGVLGAILLRYPLHLLITAACAGVFAAAAAWVGGRFGAFTAGAAAVVLVGLALWPPIAQWWTARSAGVAVSVADYWTDYDLLWRTTARPARTEVYAVAADGSQLRFCQHLRLQLVDSDRHGVRYRFARGDETPCGVRDVDQLLCWSGLSARRKAIADSAAASVASSSTSAAPAC